ncbi:MAG: hypothetical protein ACSLFD_00470 [Solirubrobacterales bacterium]
MDREGTGPLARHGHPALAAVLAGIGTLLTVALIFSLWVNNQVLDTDGWVDTSERVLEEPEIQAQVAQYVSDEFLDSVGLEGVTRADLPVQLQGLTDVTPEGLRRETPIEVLKTMNSPRFKRVWAESNRTAHETLIANLDGSNDLSGQAGAVTLDLNPIVTGTSQELGFDDSITAQIPPDVARLTIADGRDVETARGVAELTQVAPWILGLSVAVLFGGAILLAGSFRRVIVLTIGVGLVAAGGFALILRSTAEPLVVDWLAVDASARISVEKAWSIGTSQLVSISIWTMIIGVVVVLGAVIMALWPAGRETQDRFQHHPY